MKKDVDFSFCDFIEEYMWFFTYYDFCDNRHYLKRMFKTFNTNERIFYRYYVYSNIHMDAQYKNAIWDYLNDYDPHGSELLRLKKLYRSK